MRKLFLLVLIALLAGVGLVALIETDPGYILVAYGNYTLETSLWVGLAVLLLFTLLVYGVVRLLRKLFAGQQSLLGWLGNRRSRVAGRLTTRGLINFIEGNWSKSRRQLVRGAKDNEAPLLNYLIAARASHRLGEMDKMREYLGAAEAAESEAGIAVELTQAELKLSSGQYEQALATLERARRNAGRHPHVLDLLCKAYQGLKDWNSLARLLPDLRKYKVCSDQELALLERDVYAGLLAAGAAEGSEALQRQWQATPSELRLRPELLEIYAQKLAELGPVEAAEKFIQRSLKQAWHGELVRVYGLLQGGNGHKRLAQAESWLDDHRDDAALLLALGRLCCREELWGKARDYFEQCYKLERSPEVCAELGRLLAALGEPRPSGAYFREGLLAATKLPELPSPAPLPESNQLEQAAPAAAGSGT